MRNTLPSNTNSYLYASIVLILMGLLGFLYSPDDSSILRKLVPIGKVQETSPKAQVRNKGDTHWRSLNKNQVIYIDDTIMTNENGEVSIELEGDIVTEVPNSSITQISIVEELIDFELIAGTLKMALPEKKKVSFGKGRRTVTAKRKSKFSLRKSMKSFELVKEFGEFEEEINFAKLPNSNHPVFATPIEGQIINPLLSPEIKIILKKPISGKVELSDNESFNSSRTFIIKTQQTKIPLPSPGKHFLRFVGEKETSSSLSIKVLEYKAPEIIMPSISGLKVNNELEIGIISSDQLTHSLELRQPTGSKQTRLFKGNKFILRPSLMGPLSIRVKVNKDSAPWSSWLHLNIADNAPEFFIPKAQLDSFHLTQKGIEARFENQAFEKEKPSSTLTLAKDEELDEVIYSTQTKSSHAYFGLTSPGVYYWKMQEDEANNEAIVNKLIITGPCGRIDPNYFSRLVSKTSMQVFWSSAGHGFPCLVEVSTDIDFENIIFKRSSKEASSVFPIFDISHKTLYFRLKPESGSPEYIKTSSKFIIELKEKEN